MKIKKIILFISLFTISLLAEEGGYATPFSVSKGDTINFHLSTGVSPFTLIIFKIDSSAHFVAQVTNVSSSIQPLPDSAFYYQPNWPVTLKYVIPETFEPGIYRAEFPASEGNYRGVLFVVREKVPGTFSKNLLVLSTNTWQAYNNFGGKSIYEYNSSNGVRAYKVSMLRPAQYPLGRDGSADFYKYEFKFIQWLTNNNIKFELATQYELDQNQSYLQNYNLVILAGHNEYWSRRERLQLENYVGNGGKLIIFGGNTSWWQIRFEDNGNTMVCYKNPGTADPLYGVTDSLVTVNWWNVPVNYPENKLTGVSFRGGGYVNAPVGNPPSIVLPVDSGYGDYAAFNTHYWVFNGTGLKEGDQYGHNNDGIVGYEIDGANFNWINAIPVVKGDDSTPLNFRILSISPAVNYNPAVTGTHGTMGMYHNSNGGAVFNSATTDWVDGLYANSASGLVPDPIVSRISLNVINKFIENKFPPDIVSWSPYNLKPAFINGENLFLNNRDFMVKPGESLPLSILTEDPNNLPVLYQWSVNGQPISQMTTYNFVNNDNNAGPKKYEIKAKAYNSQDSTIISWNIYNSELVLSSTPVTEIKPAQKYSYQVEAYNSFNDNLTFQFLSSPSWLTISQTGLIEGFAPSDSGDFIVSVRVVNQHSMHDDQFFIIKVTNRVTDIISEVPVPTEFALSQNYPNPFNPITNFEFRISDFGFVTLKIFDVLGNELATLVNEEKEPGTYKVQFNGNNFASGIYYYQLRAGKNLLTRKMLLLK